MPRPEGIPDWVFPGVLCRQRGNSEHFIISQVAIEDVARQDIQIEVTPVTPDRYTTFGVQEFGVQEFLDTFVPSDRHDYLHHLHPMRGGLVTWVGDDGEPRRGYVDMILDETISIRQEGSYQVLFSRAEFLDRVLTVEAPAVLEGRRFLNADRGEVAVQGAYWNWAGGNENPRLFVLTDGAGVHHDLSALVPLEDLDLNEITGDSIRVGDFFYGNIAGSDTAAVLLSPMPVIRTLEGQILSVSRYQINRVIRLGSTVELTLGAPALRIFRSGDLFRTTENILFVIVQAEITGQNRGEQLITLATNFPGTPTELEVELLRSPFVRNLMSDRFPEDPPENPGREETFTRVPLVGFQRIAKQAEEDSLPQRTSWERLLDD